MIIIMITTCIVHLKALLSQWGDAICVMVMRSQHAQRSLGYNRRISYHYTAANSLFTTRRSIWIELIHLISSLVSGGALLSFTP